MIRRQFLLFLVAGGIAAVVNFLSRIGLGIVLPYAVSIVIAYAGGSLPLTRMLLPLMLTAACSRTSRRSSRTSRALP